MKSVAGLLILLLLAGCQGRPAASQVGTHVESTAQGPSQIQAAGLHNVYRITERLFSGSSPEAEEGFRSLKQLGVKTIISVDGAKPDTELARKFGLRYVHLPIGYDGVPREQALRMAKAVRELPGPTYLHCHLGKHRGPAAAAVVHLCLDEKCSIEEAVAEMRRAGTDPRYVGLYAAPKEIRRPSPRELDEIAGDFPEVATIPALAQIMVAVDQYWEHLTLAKAAGWKTPPDHPDIDPSHEALQLLEQFREVARLPGTAKQPEDFRRKLAEAEDAAKELEKALAVAKKGAEVDRAATDRFLSKAGRACINCHAKYRDTPQQR